VNDGQREESGPGESPGFLLWQVTNRWQRSIVAALKPLGLTHVQFVLLASVWWLSRDGGGPPTQREVADHAGTDPTMTSQVVRGLEQRGLLRRSRDPQDGRVRRVAGTAPGTRLAEQAIDVVEAADRAFFADAEPNELMRTLRSLAST
jgi:DNA-binding MarR family transcriptional regulator